MASTTAAASSDAKAETTPPPADEVEDWQIQRDQHKSLGDNAFRRQDFKAAIEAYSAALSVDPDNHILLSNRSACYLKNSEKSKALQDSQRCIDLNPKFAKGYSRKAAALQSLGRYGPAKETWQQVLNLDAENAAAKRGVTDCQEQLDKQKPPTPPPAEVKEEADDDLEDFFNDVDQAAKAATAPVEEESYDKISTQKKELGSAKENIDRLLEKNYEWRNLNPFFVLNLDHRSSPEEINKRYKAFSLLLHPDKNLDNPKAQEAFQQVKKAKQLLSDEDKLRHIRQLVEEGRKIGKRNWEEDKSESLERCRALAVQKLFAEIEYKRREVEKRRQKQEQRERAQEDEELEKEKNERSFEKNWRKEERVEKRIGNWRDFQKKKKPKK